MSQSELVVAGHICLDIAPAFNPAQGFEQVFCPGRLSLVGAATMATGGVVANTGLAAHKLGLDTVLMGKVGADSFGAVIQDRLARSGVKTAMSVSPDVTSSYSIVLNLAGTDRIFLHHSGANDDFLAADIDAAVVKDCRLFHFGYPPLMKSMYVQGGAELLAIMKKAKGLGVTTSLDMAMPDPSTESGRVDWEGIIQSVAPWTDIFVPSYEELFLMLARDEYLAWRGASQKQELSDRPDVTRIREFARRLQGFGMGIVMIKVGKNGIYLLTPDAARLQAFGAVTLDPAWANRELWAESCVPQVFLSSTGAGDCAIAGFLTALIRGLGPQEALRLATIAGYQNLRAVDSVSGLGDWAELQGELQNAALLYNETDLTGYGFSRIGRGLWGTEL